MPSDSSASRTTEVAIPRTTLRPEASKTITLLVELGSRWVKRQSYEVPSRRIFHPTIQPTKRDVLYDLRALRQSQSGCKSLKNRIQLVCHAEVAGLSAVDPAIQFPSPKELARIGANEEMGIFVRRRASRNFWRKKQSARPVMRCGPRVSAPDT